MPDIKEIERRYVTATVEHRASGDGPGQLYGYAAKYNAYSQNLGGFIEELHTCPECGGAASRLA